MKKFFKNHWGVLVLAAAIGIVVAVARCQPNGVGLDTAAETTSHPDGQNGKIEAMTPAEKMQPSVRLAFSPAAEKMHVHAFEHLDVTPEMVRPACDSAAHENNTSRVNATACAGNEDQDASANITPSADRQPAERHLTRRHDEAEAAKEMIDNTVEMLEKIQNFMFPMFLVVLVFVAIMLSWLNWKKTHREEKEGESLEEKFNKLKLSVPEDIWLTSARGKAELQKRYPSAQARGGTGDFFYWVAWHSLNLFDEEKISRAVLEQISKKLRNGEITTLSDYHLCLSRAKITDRNDRKLRSAADIIDTYLAPRTNETDGSAQEKDKVEHVDTDVPLDALEKAEERIEIREKLNMHIRELGVSVRVFSSLKAAGINTVADLVQHKRREIAAVKNLGIKSIREIDNILENLGLEYGMDPQQCGVFPER